MINLKGAIVALVTPFLKSVEIDYEALEKLIEWHIASGTDAIVINGSTGEGNLLTGKEQQALFETTVKWVNKRIPVIASTGSASTTQVIENSLIASRAGVDALLVATPYYVRPTQEGLYQHYKKIAINSDLPIILYNVPGRTGVDMLPDTVARLAHLKNIVALKEAVPTLKRLQQLKARLPEDFLIFSGEDSNACEWMHHGSAGVISMMANIVPAQVKQMCDAALAKDKEQANAVNKLLTPLYGVLGIESNPIPIKFALWKMNKIHNVLRLPLTPLSAQHYSAMESALTQIGILK
jgi:4-hydroxy-tetrahydrodipicolinate synthase